MKESPFKITEFTNRSKSTSYRVSGMRNVMKDGVQVRERYRKNWMTKAEALSDKNRLEAEYLNAVVPAQLIQTNLDREEVQNFERVNARLKGDPRMKGRSLDDILQFFEENFTEPVKKRLLADAIKDFLAVKISANKREDTIRNLRGRLNQFLNFDPMNERRLVSDVLEGHVTDFLDRPGLTPQSKINDRAVLTNFFNWSVKKKYCTDDPAGSTERPEVDEIHPEVLDFADAMKLIETAATFKEGKLVPYVALCLFCAIRPDGEIQKIKWDQIDLEHRVIPVNGRMAKMRGIRDVEISENCVEWLRPHKLKRTVIIGTNWRREWEVLREMCGFKGTRKRPVKGFKPWVPDYLRHTGITYHMGRSEHEGRTARWAGNSPDTILKHYLGRGVKKAEIEAFWKITPSDIKTKIIKLEAA